MEDIFAVEIIERRIDHTFFRNGVDDHSVADIDGGMSGVFALKGINRGAEVAGKKLVVFDQAALLVLGSGCTGQLNTEMPVHPEQSTPFFRSLPP